MGGRSRRRGDPPGQGNHRARHRDAWCRTRTSQIVLYCGGGFRSALAADALQKMGYTDVVSLDGGWRDYLAAGLPVER